MSPVRTCIGCRSRASRAELLRIVAQDGRLHVDSAATAPGRGAWVHPSAECIGLALQRRAFGRALRLREPDTQPVRELVQQLVAAPSPDPERKG